MRPLLPDVLAKQNSKFSVTSGNMLPLGDKFLMSVPCMGMGLFSIETGTEPLLVCLMVSSEVNH